jgi:hypothetical protein
MPKKNLTTYSFIIFALLLWGQRANAKEQAIPSLGVTVQIPENWKVEVREGKNRTMAFLKPNFEAVDSAFHCTIDRQVTPESTKGYTQKQINSFIEEKSFTAHDFSTQLTALNGSPVSILQNGKSMLGANMSYWAVSTASQTEGLITAHFMSKIYLTQTPGYSWDVQCIAGSTTNETTVAIFKSGQPILDQFFGTFQFGISAK